MRISTAMIQAGGAGGIIRNQAELYRLQQQLSTGRKLVTAGDNPVGAVRAVSLADAKALNDRYRTNQDTAQSQLELSESTLAGVGDTLSDIRERVIQAASGALSESDRQSIASDVRNMYDRLLALANTRDASGGYIFGGYRELVQPFTDQPAGAACNGDQGQRLIQVSTGRSLVVAENGAEIFNRVKTGNGTFTAAQNTANTGSGRIDQGSVVTPSAITGDTYSIQFAVTGSTTTYSVVDTTTSTTLSSGNAYTDGAGITVAGMQVSISGAPANGDSFTLAPSQNQSVFTSIVNVIQALQRGTPDPASRARLSNDVGTALSNIDQAIDKTLTVRATMGASLREIDTLRNANSDTDLQFQTELSRITDVDYAKTISDFTAQQQALQAAQSSFARISQRSLFDVI